MRERRSDERHQAGGVLREAQREAPPPHAFQAAPQADAVGAITQRSHRGTDNGSCRARQLNQPRHGDADNYAVHTEHLSKVYRDFWGRDKVRALDDLSLTIHRGEVFGLLGPNGSGKSTTIKLLLGLIFATRGKAWVLGEPAGSTRSNERIGFLPEESYLYRFLNGEETLRFYGRLFKIPSKELKRRVATLLGTVGA